MKILSTNYPSPLEDKNSLCIKIILANNLLHYLLQSYVYVSCWQILLSDSWISWREWRGLQLKLIWLLPVLMSYMITFNRSMIQSNNVTFTVLWSEAALKFIYWVSGREPPQSILSNSLTTSSASLLSDSLQVEICRALHNASSLYGLQYR